MKEIWKQFKSACATAWADMVDGVKEVCRTTWALFKDTCLNFVKGLFTWISELAGGLIIVVIGFVELVWAALVALIKAAFDLIYNKIIKWIMKW